MNRCLLLLTIAWALGSCATRQVGTEPHSGLKQRCDAGSDAACHDYAFFTYDANPPEAEQAYRQLCERKLARACSNLAHRLAERAAPDFEQARVFYERGCELKDGVACHHLANLYILAQGVAKDDQRALSLLEESCDLAYAQACFRVSVIIQRGKLTAADPQSIHVYGARLRTDRFDLVSRPGIHVSRRARNDKVGRTSSGAVQVKLRPKPAARLWKSRVSLSDGHRSRAEL